MKDAFCLVTQQTVIFYPLKVNYTIFVSKALYYIAFKKIIIEGANLTISACLKVDSNAWVCHSYCQV